MLKEIGLVVNCGRWRLAKPVKSSVMLNLAASVEIPEPATSETIEELRGSIQDLINHWCRSHLGKQKKQLKEKKKVKHGS